MGQKVINLSICRLPVSPDVLSDLAGILHFRWEQIRLCDPVTKSGIIIERGVARDALRSGRIRQGLCEAYSFCRSTSVFPFVAPVSTPVQRIVLSQVSGFFGSALKDRLNPAMAQKRILPTGKCKPV